MWSVFEGADFQTAQRSRRDSGHPHLTPAPAISYRPSVLKRAAFSSGTSEVGFIVSAAEWPQVSVSWGLPAETSPIL
jgi:hypothetical protein